MFSNLGPLFKATIRQAEKVDTRMAIRKDEPRDEGRKKDPREEEDEDSALWEDSMGVSIESLRAFLINFVSGQTAHVAGTAGLGLESSDDTAIIAPQPEIREPQNTQTARAMQAYQSMADKGVGAYHPPPPPAATSDVDLVQAEDVRLIHALIADLVLLGEAGHETLPLEKSDTFLHAIQEAVARLKSGV